MVLKKCLKRCFSRFVDRFAEIRRSRGLRAFEKRGLTAFSIFLVLVLLTCCIAGGCGSEQSKVQEYLGKIRPILHNMTLKLDEFRQTLSLPLSEMGAVKESLQAFRKANNEGRAELDRMDAPEPCRELDKVMGWCGVKGIETANTAAPLADYLSELALLANQIDGIVEEILSLEDRVDPASAIAELGERAQSLYSSYRMVVVPSEFKEVHEVLGEFIIWLNTELNKAKGKKTTTPEKTEYPEEENGSRTYDEETNGSTRDSLSGSAKQLAREVPAEWGRVSGETGAMVGELVQSTGLKTKMDETYNYIMQAQGLLLKLDKEYRKEPAR